MKKTDWETIARTSWEITKRYVEIPLADMIAEYTHDADDDGSWEARLLHVEKAAYKLGYDKAIEGAAKECDEARLRSIANGKNLGNAYAELTDHAVRMCEYLRSKILDLMAQK